MASKQSAQDGHVTAITVVSGSSRHASLGNWSTGQRRTHGLSGRDVNHCATVSLVYYLNVQSQRYRLRYDGMIHILEIPKVRDYDSGNLRIVAKNPVGAVECTSSLSVVARDDWRSRLKQAPRCESEFSSNTLTLLECLHFSLFAR